MAFGFCIKEDDLNNFINECNEKLQNIDTSSDYVEVDAIFNKNNINEKIIEEFAKYSNLYGMGLPQPKIAIESNYIAEEVQLMKNNSFKFKFGNISCIGLKNEEIYNSILNNYSGHFILIGEPNINEFNGSTNLQLIIKKIEIEPIQIKNLF